MTPEVFVPYIIFFIAGAMVQYIATYQKEAGLRSGIVMRMYKGKEPMQPMSAREIQIRKRVMMIMVMITALVSAIPAVCRVGEAVAIAQYVDHIEEQLAQDSVVED